MTNQGNLNPSFHSCFLGRTLRIFNSKWGPSGGQWEMASYNLCSAPRLKLFHFLGFKIGVIESINTLPRKDYHPSLAEHKRCRRHCRGY